MEQSNNQTSLCRMGCGFYGSETCEGMCSKCYKDSLKRKQAASAEPSSEKAAEALSTSAAEALSTSAAEGLPTSAPREETPDDTATAAAPADEAGAIADVTTASPTVSAPIPVPGASKDPQVDTPCGSVGSVDSISGSPGSEKRRKNRCTTCRKKVGLTGFTCRCGGLFCSNHRYSDRHDCPFNYQQEGQEQIRKNNPVIKGQKIQKI